MEFFCDDLVVHGVEDVKQGRACSSGKAEVVGNDGKGLGTAASLWVGDLFVLHRVIDLRMIQLVTV